MQLKDFAFEVPQDLVAQTPLDKRDDSRLLVNWVCQQKLEDESFKNLPKILRKIFPHEPILIVANNSKVYPARVRIKRATGARGEVFITNRFPNSDGSYDCLLRPLKKLRVGEQIYCEKTGAALFDIASLEPPRVRLLLKDSDINQVLDDVGEMPLPPYINRDPTRVGEQYAQMDDERYQTIYAAHIGSMAAPTAGLHMTQAVLDDATRLGIEFAYVTLHVGLGTFQPVQVDNINEHKMHSEFYTISTDVYNKIESVRRVGGKIVFVGTTSLRAVESFYRLTQTSELKNCLDVVLQTDLFLNPKDKSGRTTPIVGDAIVTNFHQPESTLAMLVAALMGYDFWKIAYMHAIAKRYRFFSYGDSNLILL